MSSMFFCAIKYAERQLFQNPKRRRLRIFHDFLTSFEMAHCRFLLPELLLPLSLLAILSWFDASFAPLYFSAPSMHLFYLSSTSSYVLFSLHAAAGEPHGAQRASSASSARLIYAHAQSVAPTPQTVAALGSQQALA